MITAGRVDFERYFTTSGQFHCVGCGAVFPNVHHTSNCPRASEDKRVWPKLRTFGTMHHYEPELATTAPREVNPC